LVSSCSPRWRRVSLPSSTKSSRRESHERSRVKSECPRISDLVNAHGRFRLFA
jgi:hypothetical protein